MSTRSAEGSEVSVIPINPFEAPAGREYPGLCRIIRI